MPDSALVPVPHKYLSSDSYSVPLSYYVLSAYLFFLWCCWPLHICPVIHSSGYIYSDFCSGSLATSAVMTLYRFTGNLWQEVKLTPAVISAGPTPHSFKQDGKSSGWICAWNGHDLCVCVWIGASNSCGFACRRAAEEPTFVCLHAHKNSRDRLSLC